MTFDPTRRLGNSEDATLSGHFAGRNEPLSPNRDRCTDDCGRADVSVANSDHLSGKDGHAALDQIRTIDKARLVRRLGTINSETVLAVAMGLAQMFSVEADPS